MLFSYSTKTKKIQSSVVCMMPRCCFLVKHIRLSLFKIFYLITPVLPIDSRKVFALLLNTHTVKNVKYFEVSDTFLGQTKICVFSVTCLVKLRKVGRIFFFF